MIEICNIQLLRIRKGCLIFQNKGKILIFKIILKNRFFKLKMKKKLLILNLKLFKNRNRKKLFMEIK